MVEALNNLPPWIGSVPAWSALIIMLGYIAIQALKNKPVLNQQAIDDRHRIKEGYVKRIEVLEAAVKECERKCDEREEIFKEQIEKLQERIRNEAEQRVQSEISLVATLIDVVPAEQLKKVLAALQAKQVRLQSLAVEALSGPLTRAGADGDDSERS